MWQTPVIDRTQSDVEYARDNRGSASLLKGAQNYTDWRRLALNMYSLAITLQDYGQEIALHCKYNWKMGDIPTWQEIAEIRKDLIYLRELSKSYTGYTFLEWDELKQTWESLNQKKLNADN